MINFDAVDFSERRSKEVISFFWRSVYKWNHIQNRWLISRWKFQKNNLFEAWVTQTSLGPLNEGWNMISTQQWKMSAGPFFESDKERSARQREWETTEVGPPIASIVASRRFHGEKCRLSGSVRFRVNSCRKGVYTVAGCRARKLSLKFLAFKVLISHVMVRCYHVRRFLIHEYSIGEFEWIFISLLKSAAFSLQTSENNIKPP